MNILFILFYSFKPWNQVRILLYRNWSIVDAPLRIPVTLFLVNNNNCQILANPCILEVKFTVRIQKL